MKFCKLLPVFFLTNSIVFCDVIEVDSMDNLDDIFRLGDR